VSRYCTQTEALALTPTFGELSSTTTPSEAQADGYVATVSQEMDLHLAAAGVDLPVSDGGALGMLASIASYGVAALLLKARFPAATGPGGDTGSAAFFEEKYQTAMQLIDGGAFSSTTTSEASTFGEGFTTTLDDDGGAVTSDPTFRRLMEF